MFFSFRLSEYVEDAVQSSELVSLLLPFLSSAVHRSQDVELSILQVVRNLLLRAAQPEQFIT